ncbi:MAG: 30S ribosomal protein S6 [Firmicutes bacterium]|nr:30S ribosomal protein S6 [Bacillota bacterium]
MRTYELVFIVKPDLEEEATAAVVDKFTGLITEQGGTVANVDKWGKRHLAYEVKGYNDGYYIIVNFQAEPKASKEVERVLKISDDVIKHMVIKLDD